MMNQKGLIKIILVVVVILVAGHYLWAKTGYLDFVKPRVFKLCCVKDETAGWKIYSDNNYGYSFRYPNDDIGYLSPEGEAYMGTLSEAQKGDHNNLIVGDKSGFPIIDIKVEDLAGNMQTLSTNSIGDKEVFNDPIEVRKNNIIFKKYTAKKNIINGHKVVYTTTYNGLYYFIGLSDMYLAEPIFKTFEITNNPLNKKQDETQNWKTYHSDRYNFEVKYPPRYVTGAGKISQGSQLGINGVLIGPLIFVSLDTNDSLEKAKKYFDMVGGNCYVENLANINNRPVDSYWIQMKYCTGEGGPAYYIFIRSKDFNMFVDGYSGDSQDIDVYKMPPGRFLNKSELELLFSTFKILK